MTLLHPAQVAWFIAAETALARRDRTWPGGLEGLLHAGFEEIGRAGRRWTRDETVTLLATDEPNEIDLLDVAATSLADDVVLLRFETGTGAARVRRASIWVREDDRWRLRHHQGTGAGEATPADADRRLDACPSGSTSSIRRATTSRRR